MKGDLITNDLFKPVKWDDIKGGELTVYLNASERKAIFSKIGYSVDKQGFLIDEKTKQRVKISEGIELKPEDIKGVMAGSHILIRNIGDLAEELAKRNELKITPSK